MDESEIAVRGEYITLGQLLKLTGAVDSGAGLKEFLASAAISVNGESDNRRGRKLRPGDVVKVGDSRLIRLI